MGASVRLGPSTVELAVLLRLVKAALSPGKRCPMYQQAVPGSLYPEGSVTLPPWVEPFHAGCALLLSQTCTLKIQLAPKWTFLGHGDRLGATVRRVDP